MVFAVPNIEIVQSHSVTAEEARRRLERFGALLTSRYGLTPLWTSLTKATVDRAGARGSLEIESDQVRVEISLPFVYAPLKEKVETRIRRELGYLFADETTYDDTAFSQVYGAIGPGQGSA